MSTTRHTHVSLEDWSVEELLSGGMDYRNDLLTEALLSRTPDVIEGIESILFPLWSRDEAEEESYMLDWRAPALVSAYATMLMSAYPIFDESSLPSRQLSLWSENDLAHSVANRSVSASKCYSSFLAQLPGTSLPQVIYEYMYEEELPPLYWSCGKALSTQETNAWVTLAWSLHPKALHTALSISRLFARKEFLAWIETFFSEETQLMLYRTHLEGGEAETLDPVQQWYGKWTRLVNKKTDWPLLRAVLLNGDAGQLWKGICRVVEGWPLEGDEFAIVASYVKQHCKSLPRDVCTAPEHWAYSLLHPSNPAYTAYVGYNYVPFDDACQWLRICRGIVFQNVVCRQKDMHSLVQALSELSHLESLHFLNCNLPDIHDWQEVFRACSFPHLKSWTMGFHASDEQPSWTAFLNTPWLQQLEHFGLWHQHLDLQDVATLVDSGILDNIESLDLRGCQSSEQSMERLFLHVGSRIRSLMLDDDLFPGVLSWLASHPVASQLTSMELVIKASAHDRVIGVSEDFDAFVHSDSFPKLRHLQLHPDSILQRFHEPQIADYAPSHRWSHKPPPMALYIALRQLSTSNTHSSAVIAHAGTQLDCQVFENVDLLPIELHRATFPLNGCELEHAPRCQEPSWSEIPF